MAASPTLCQVRFCKPTQEAREAMSADIVRELRQKFGEEKAEEIHPNQDPSDLGDLSDLSDASPVPSKPSKPMASWFGAMRSGLKLNVEHSNLLWEPLSSKPIQAVNMSQLLLGHSRHGYT